MSNFAPQFATMTKKGRKTRGFGIIKTIRIMAKKVQQNNNAPSFEETLSKKEAFFLKHKKTIIISVIAIVAIIAGYILYDSEFATPREDHASTILAKGQQYFSDQEMEKALNGDSADYKGFLYIAKEYSSTKAGNLANLYAGLCYAQLEKWQECADYLEKYDNADDMMIGPSAMAALGNAYAHLNQLDKAVNCLKKAADMADNNSISPTFLIQAGEILESQGKADEALKLYEKVKNTYYNSMQYQEIDKYIERVSK